MEEDRRRLSFTLRVIQNRIKAVIHNSVPCSPCAPQSQLQGGILGYLYHHQENSVYQRDIEREFHISRATATNTLQVMERNGLITRKALDRDARLKRILMTEEALQNHRCVEENMDRLDERMLRGLEPAEIQDLYRMLDTVFHNLEEYGSEQGEDGRDEGHTAANDNGEKEIEQKYEERKCDKC